MKTSYRFMMIASLLGVFYVMGCGSNGNNNSCGAGYQNVNNQCISSSQYLQNGGSCQGSCAVGQVQTSMGCVAPATQCGSCAGINPSTGQCVQAIQTGTTGYNNGYTGYGTPGYGTSGYGTTGYGTTGYPTSYGYGSTGYPYGYGSTGYGYSSYPYYH